MARLLDWFDGHARDLPWRRTRDPYAIWVSEVMLQQTQVQTVIPYWERWMSTLPDVAELAAAPLDRVLKLWEGLGYYSRARNLQRAAQTLVNEHGGVFPTTLPSLLALPGIGRYTAGAIASIAFNQPAPIVDGNVMRVLTRVFALAGNPKERPLNERLWKLAGELVRIAADRGPKAKRSCASFNQALMELGATVCRPTGPNCDRCPLRAECRAHALNQVDRFPAKPARARSIPRWFATAMVRCQGAFLVRRRPAGDFNAGFWEFPNFELPDGRSDGARELGALLRVDPASLRSDGELRHAITRYRMTQRIYQVEISVRKQRVIPTSAGRWVTPSELEALHLTGPHRKLARRILR